jgi:hypothetical protein
MTVNHTKAEHKRRALAVKASRRTERAEIRHATQVANAVLRNRRQVAA